MSRMKRRLGAGALVGLVAALAFAVPAQAEVKAACVVAGFAKTNPPIALVGGKGTFLFTNLVLVCAGVAKGAPTVESGSVVAAGVFKNVICGTGKAVGTVTSSTSAFADKVVGAKFAVEFVGFQGTFYWHSGDWAKPVLPTKVLDQVLNQKPTTTKTWALAGQIAAGSPLLVDGKTHDPPSVGCTKPFALVGAFIVDIGPHA